MVEGTGEAVATVEIAAAFAFLANPQNSTAWFAGAHLIEEPAGSLREGLTWRLEKTPGTRRILPMCMTVYQPPERFVWATQLSGLATNNVWELRFQPGDEAGTTKLLMTFRLKLGPIGWLTRLIAPAGLRRTLNTRAQQAAERASEALAAPKAPKAPRKGTTDSRSSRGRKRQ